MFRKEAQYMQFLGESPHFVKLECTLEQDNKFYFIMENCEQGNLYSAIQQGIFLNMNEIISDLVQAVRWMHGQGYLHRDIKLGNILLSKGRAKLGDLGLMCATREAEKFPMNNCERVGYFAPELVSPFRRVSSEKSDIWSLGLVFFRLLAGNYSKYQNLSSEANKLSEQDLFQLIGESSIENSKKQLLFGMLCHDPDRRLNIFAVEKQLSSIASVGDDVDRMEAVKPCATQEVKELSPLFGIGLAEVGSYVMI